MEKKRLQKAMAEAGVASRRASEALIKEGKVLVNGMRARIGQSVTDDDVIEVNGRSVQKKAKKYLMLNKPAGYVVSRSEQGGGKTIYDIPSVPRDVYPVGRLDKETEGLLLLTNDGDFAFRLTHPKFEVPKTYEVFLDRPLSREDRGKIDRGVWLTDEDDQKYQVVDVKIETKAFEPKTLRLTLHIGKNHVVRKLFGSLGYAVQKLRRVQIGSLKGSMLALGKVRPLTQQQVKNLVQR